MPIQKYLLDIEQKLRSGVAREHAYRPALKILLEEAITGISALNDPARIYVGNLDFILRRGEIEIGYLEAKDINANLNKVEKSEQMQRYLDLPNLILTDYLEFRFYKEGKKTDTVRIADVMMDKLVPRPENFQKLIDLLHDFGVFQSQTIKSAQKLAEMMARKARLMREVFYEVLTRPEPTTLKEQYDAFKTILMHDLDRLEFADIYAQTITYGLFTARLHDPTLENFSRAEAQDLIPKSNPFLRQLFHYVTGPDLDARTVKYVDDLCQVFLATNVRQIFENYGANTKQTDPILHFYETFLGAYDKSLRKARGVWYTPEPVVQFIVRAIDDVLKTHFDLKDGIADTSTTEIDVDTQTRDDRSPTGYKRIKKEIHKVQLLDVATGTGTFLAETVKRIYDRYKDLGGAWSAYVEDHLLPRMHGFELLMASYAMCHMKLDLLLTEMGYKPRQPENPPRLSVYLTNSLEEHHPDADTLFASWLSREANEASRIKRDRPIMVAFGNPPYSGISSNMNSWIAKTKIEDYKYVDGVHFNERKHWLNDDYVQFIRLGEHYIEKNGEGVLAYITNHSYLDNPTFRGMRWHLLNTFDEIYVLDLHGNALKKEVSPDGSPDINVFDIQQGVAIIIAIKKKTGQRNNLAKLYHHDFYGVRSEKYKRLSEESIQTINWQEVKFQDSFFNFLPRQEKHTDEYQNGFYLNTLFPTGSTGVQTSRDTLVIDSQKDILRSRIEYFVDIQNSDESVRQRFFGNKKEGKYLAGDTRGWSLSTARKTIRNFNHEEKIKRITYRPFDNCWVYYDTTMVDWSREATMSHTIKGENLCLIIGRQGQVVGNMAWNLCFATTYISDLNLFYRGGGLSFPLYRYEAVMGDIEQKVPNFAPAIYNKIKETAPNATPETLFDYIYAVLHSPVYRKRYAEFLKSDFPRIPYPRNESTFNKLAEKGSEIRLLHLMESNALEDTGITYPEAGENIVEKPRYEDDRVYINAKQYFGGVPKTAWEFYIGGYQPAQKWLKDRKGRSLSFDDIEHYRKVIKALSETDRIMKEIEQIDFLPSSAS
ncbi:MAG: DNA methyltransferase [Alphaproteobacteria bacterium]|nr:DNA methyltransferase [Alphaproteobacteria bacterium]